MYPPPPPGYALPYPMYPPPHQRPDGGAIAVEAILSFFGVYGVGWLMSRLTTVGAIIMTAGFVWDIVAVLTFVFTAGVGICCLLPIHHIFIAVSTIVLANQHVVPQT